MKIWITLFILFSGYMWSQNTPTIGVLPDNGPVIPLTCTIGQLYFKTAATTGLNQCTATNTWTVVPLSGGGGTVTNTGGALTANAVILGAGGSDTKVSTGITTNGGSELDLGVSGTSGVIGLNGSTSGKATFTAPAVAGTSTNPVAMTNGLTGPTTAGCTTATYSFTGLGNTGFSLDTGPGTPTVCVSGNETFRFAGTLFEVSASNFGLIWNNSTNFSGSFDLGLFRAGAGLVEVSNSSSANSSGSIKVAGYQTDTNCAAVGTAANPSVVSCVAATAGSFSCATNASTGTCTVNTTAVTANSEIFIEGRNDSTTGTRLSVTCNTGITTALPEISAVVAATSFTINLGTFTTNPECFSYFIVN